MDETPPVQCIHSFANRKKKMRDFLVGMRNFSVLQKLHDKIRNSVFISSAVESRKENAAIAGKEVGLPIYSGDVMFLAGIRRFQSCGFACLDMYDTIDLTAAASAQKRGYAPATEQISGGMLRLRPDRCMPGQETFHISHVRPPRHQPPPMH